MKRALTPFTYAEIPEGGSVDRLRWQAANCDTLAEFMAALPKEKHKQDRFCQVSVEHECGTAGCAMGWAAMSGLFPGLQYGLSRFEDGMPSGMSFAVINGKPWHWLGAGEVFFGSIASYKRIFARTWLTKTQVVERLRGCATTLRREAEKMAGLKRSKRAA